MRRKEREKKVTHVKKKSQHILSTDSNSPLRIPPY